MRLGITLLLAAALVLGGIFLFRGETARIGVALGLAEGCVACHGRVTGLAGVHAPERIGCASCHAGDRRTMDKTVAHAGMVLVPGNLADASRTCGQSGCHEAIVPRVERSIMATMAGVIAVNRAVLGEPAREGEAIPHAQRLGHDVADSHLRELCVGCHLGQAKADWGPIGEESQGGGCNACHLEYSAEAAGELKRYAAMARKDRTASPATHPSLTLNPRNGHCFGCHSRSGRIGLGYEGWNEMHTPDGSAPAGAGTPKIRKLDDGRFVEKVVPDIHHERGLECIDCHTANEIMGAGAIVARKSQQQRVGCEDCHAREPASVAAGIAGSRVGQAARASQVDPRAGAAHGNHARRRAAGERRGGRGQGRAPPSQAHGRLAPPEAAARGLHRGQGPRAALLRELPRRVGPALRRLPHDLRSRRRGVRPRGPEVGEGHVERDGRPVRGAAADAGRASRKATRAARSTPSCPA